MGSMKVHKLARGFWEHAEPSLTLGCKRLRPLAPMLPNTATTVSSFDLKTFIIRPESSPRDLKSSDEKRNSPQIITGGTRWNPTQEQIVILEMLYKGGIQTPNQQQIEQITSQLRKYGKIEGKNVFYWFQNHKARERQKQKRNSLGLTHFPRSPSAAASFTTISLESREREEDICPCKRKYMSWSFECLGEDVKSCKEEGERTLELFPLHPGGR